MLKVFFETPRSSANLDLLDNLYKGLLFIGYVFICFIFVPFKYF